MSITRDNGLLRLTSVFLLTLIAGLNLSDRVGVSIIALLFVLYTFSFLLLRSYRKKLFVSKTIIFFMFWLMYALAQVMFVDLSNRTFSHLQSLIFGICIIILISRLLTEDKHFLMLYKAWGITVLITLIIAWWEIITGNHLSGSGAVQYNLIKSATVGFYNPNDYSFFLTLSIPIILQWVKLNGLYRFLGLFMLGSSLYVMIINGSRLSIIVVLTLTVLYVYSLWRSKKKKLFTFYLLVITCSTIVFQDVVVQALEELSTLSGNNNSLIVRNNLMDSAFDIFIEYPLGVGSGNLEMFMPVIGHKAHNFWLEILVNYGLFVFVGLILFFVLILWSLLRFKDKENIMPLFWVVLIFIPTCVISSSIFQQPILWFVLGIMVSLKTYSNKKKYVRKSYHAANRVSVMYNQ